ADDLSVRSAARGRAGTDDRIGADRDAAGDARARASAGVRAQRVRLGASGSLRYHASHMGSPRRAWVAVTLFYIALTVGYAWRLLPVIGSALPNDIGDPGLNTWIIWWNAHAIPLTQTWWNGPIFFPAPGALALSETFLNLVPIATPMQWLGASAVLTYNVMY